MFDVCTTGDMAHINTIFKLLPLQYIPWFKQKWLQIYPPC